MSQPSSAATPVTPSRRIGTPTATTPGSAQGHPRCPSDESQFKKIEIHTARCTLCEARNTDDRMRRCPICHTQFCGNCRDKRNDNLTHGIDTPKGTPNRKPLPMLTPNRRPLTPSTPVAAKPVPVATTPNAPGDVKPVPAATKPAPRKTPASVVQQKLKDAAQEATPPTSGEKRHMSGKPTPDYDAYDMSDLPDTPEAAGDDDFEPDSPSHKVSSRKRQKTTAGGRAKSGAANGSPEKRTKLTPQTKPAMIETQVSKKDKGKEPEAAADAPTRSKKSKGLEVAAGAPDKQLPNNKEAVDAYYPELAGVKYDEHFLAHSQPIPNRNILVPPSIRNWHTPRPSAEKHQRAIANQVGKNLTGLGWTVPPLPSIESADGSMEQIEDALTIRESTERPHTIRNAVEVEAQSFRQQMGLDAFQMNYAVEKMEVAAFKVRDDAYDKLPALFRASVAPGLEMQLAMLNDQQQHSLTEKLRDAAKVAIKGNQLGNMPTMESAERSTLG